MTVLDNIPKYTSKDFPIMVGSMLPMAVLLNYFIFGSRYFTDIRVLSWATIITFALLCLAFFIYGLVAISLRSRLPNDNELGKRLAITITIFVLMTGVYLSLVLRGYDWVNFLGYEYSENDFRKSFLTFVVMNVFLTFLNEGVSRFESYKTTIMETEQLKKEYMQSQLLGLKSQMNPHFLFNGLNTLSCLIQEDADKAEDFLNHMSKVYRYLLRNNEEQLVELETELGFIKSYYYLLKARHADSLNLSIEVSPDHNKDLIPPLTLQMILEDSTTQNSTCKDCPLFISIRSQDHQLVIINSIQPKLNNTEGPNDRLENISNKFRLLCQKDVVIEETPRERIITLPLIPNKELIEA
jgi:sensor histidine kinase YesM